MEVLLRDVKPVAHAALCDALKEEKLILGRPVRAKHVELQIVKNDVFPKLFVLVFFSWHLHPIGVTMKTDDQWLTLCFPLSRPDFDTLVNILITQTAKLWSDEIFKCLHFGIEKVRRIRLVT